MQLKDARKRGTDRRKYSKSTVQVGHRCQRLKMKKNVPTRLKNSKRWNSKRDDGTLQKGQLMELERGDGTTRRGNNAKRTVDGTGEG